MTAAPDGPGHIVCLVLSLWLSAAVIGCAASRNFVPPPPVPDDRRPIAEPEEREYRLQEEYINRQLTDEIGDALDLSRQLRNLAGKPKQALNVDAFGEVANSSWFTNRNGLERMSLEQIARGPDAGTGPDTSDTWTVTRAKAEGVTPGFSIRDGRGENYLIKFDPRGYAELASGAEVVTTKLFHAAGYNVPENYVIYFRPGMLKLGDGVKITDEKGHKRLMTEQDLADILSAIEPLPDGRIRALASKYIPGKLIGPFKYKGIRHDDPNDLIPHQHRRELRGLRLICAWLNHFDTKEGNTLDSYVTVDEVSYVKHYLIDLGATLGSASWGPNHLWRGHQFDFDPEEMLVSAVTLGLYIKPWERQEGIEYPAVGFFESQLFRPEKYKGQLPNPAFDNMTDLDAFWAARIITSFTDQQIQTAVAQGRYSDPEAEAYLVRTIIERRDIIGRHYFRLVNPLDRFRLERDFERQWGLRFVDLAVDRGYEDVSQTEYLARVVLLPGGILADEFRITGERARIPLRGYPGITSRTRGGQIEVTLQVRRDQQEPWSKWVRVYLDWDEADDAFHLLGLIREN
jgi:hypothetical protein